MIKTGEANFHKPNGHTKMNAGIEKKEEKYHSSQSGAMPGAESKR